MSNVGLVESSMVISLSCGYPTFRHQSKRGKEIVATNAGVSETCGNYWKKAIDHPAHNRIKAVGQAARQMYYLKTSPWKENARIIPVKLLMRFSKDIPAVSTFSEEFDRLKVDWDIAVDEFMAVYDSLAAHAPTRLKELYNPHDYPPASVVRERFYLRYDIDPIPTANDFRIGLVNAQMEEVKREVEDRLTSAHKQAVSDMWKRLEECVSDLHTTLSDPNKKFWDTKFENAKAVCDTLASLNIFGDSDVESIRVEVATQLASLNTDALRSDNIDPTGYRAKAATKAAEILARVKQFGG